MGRTERNIPRRVITDLVLTVAWEVTHTVSTPSAANVKPVPPMGPFAVRISAQTSGLLSPPRLGFNAWNAPITWSHPITARSRLLKRRAHRRLRPPKGSGRSHQCEGAGRSAQGKSRIGQTRPSLCETASSPTSTLARRLAFSLHISGPDRIRSTHPSTTWHRLRIGWSHGNEPGMFSPCSSASSSPPTISA